MSNARNLLDRYFRLSEHGTSVRTELLGGLTTFLAMAYIIVANPGILKNIGLQADPSTVATILAAVFGCLLMGVYANRPLAVAPYMGENAFIAFGMAGLMIDGHAIGWQQQLGSVFVAGAIFLVLTVVGLRGALVRAISPSMKRSFGVGIGLFMLFIGLKETGIVAKPDAPGSPPVELGKLGQPEVQLALLGFIAIAALMYWRVRGGILIGMIALGVLGCLLGLGKAPEGIVAVPWNEPYRLDAIAGQLDIRGVLRIEFLPVLLTLVLISFLDTLGTLVGVGEVAGMMDADGHIKDIEKPMLVDAVSCMFSALVGTSTSGAYIESATGIREGARTGLAAVVTGLLFASALFFLPLVKPLQEMKFANFPALMAVGLLMVGEVRKIDFDDMTEGVPALATIALMVFTYNIANGLTAGLVLYPLFKLLAWRWRELNWGSVVLGGVCLVYFVFGVPH